jgi:hypothetical protein
LSPEAHKGYSRPPGVEDEPISERFYKGYRSATPPLFAAWARFPQGISHRLLRTQSPPSLALATIDATQPTRAKSALQPSRRADSTRGHKASQGILARLHKRSGRGFTRASPKRCLQGLRRCLVDSQGIGRNYSPSRPVRSECGDTLPAIPPPDCQRTSFVGQPFLPAIPRHSLQASARQNAARRTSRRTVSRVYVIYNYQVIVK